MHYHITAYILLLTHHHLQGIINEKLKTEPFSASYDTLSATSTSDSNSRYTMLTINVYDI